MEIKINDLYTPPPLPSTAINKMIVGTKVALWNKVSSTMVLGVSVPQYTVLLGRKKTDLKWQFPGGKVDPEETFEQAAVREMKEEASVDLKENRLGYLKSFLTKKQGEAQSRLYVLFAGPYEGYFKAGDDIVELRWFSLEDMDNNLLDTHKAFGKVLKEHLYAR
jgi:8-oxo-dGTP diphosphatase